MFQYLSKGCVCVCKCQRQKICHWPARSTVANNVEKIVNELEN